MKDTKNRGWEVATSWLRVVAKELEHPVRPCSTGSAGLDLALGGGLTHDMGLVIGGPSESGKSLLVQNVTWSLLSAGVPVALIDFENGRSRLLRRFLALAGFSAAERLPGGKDERAQRAYRRAMALVRERFALLVAPRPADVRDKVTLGREIARLRAARPTGPLVVVIDSLHKLPMEGADQRVALDAWCVSLEHLRAAHAVTVIATAEVGRGHETDPDPFKSTTGIKYGNDVALVLHGLGGGRTGKLRVLKHRDHSESPRSFHARIDFPHVVISEAPKLVRPDPGEVARDIVRELLRTSPSLGREEIKRKVPKRASVVVAAIEAGIEAGEFDVDGSGRLRLAVPAHSGIVPTGSSSRSHPAGPSGGPAGRRRGQSNKGEDSRAKRRSPVSEANHHAMRASRAEGAPPPRFHVTETDDE